SIRQTNQDYSVSMYFRQIWVDERLAYDVKDGLKNVTRLGEGSWETIWTPDIFLRNEKRASFHEVTVDNRLLTLNHTGSLWYVIKVSATLSCPMKLQKYPMDTQICPMMFESCIYTMDAIYFSWYPKTVEYEKNMQMPQFKVQSHYLYDCVQNYTAGAFPCLAIKFVFRRDFGYFFIQVYVPSMLIVILSWVSFWLNIEASPARVSIGLLTVLTMTTQSAGVNASLPRVSYIKAVDVWMSMCLIFVFIALLEYALVNVMSRRHGRRNANVLTTLARCHQHFEKQPGEGASRQQNMLQRRPMQHVSLDQFSSSLAASIQNQLCGGRAPNTTAQIKDGLRHAKEIDRMSRKLFPLTFLLFNVFYWTAYAL
ncbi:hypothetical protein HELRODRAFT_131046, partial [Helobdella robusta]|uniref:Uncharacterized protein n=1 Tax=Helobdella robusta TaxID=6412 RepID=T1EHV1_HELRO